MFCTPKVQKWTAFGLFGSFFVCGTVLVLFWAKIFNSYLHQELVLSPGSMQYNFWKETPFDINTEMYLFNWTNSDEVNNKHFKPRFEQIGPYVFGERHSRANIVFNSNKTVSFNSIKTWTFKPDRSNGSMTDVITVMNPLVLAMGNVARTEHELIRKGINYFVKEYNKGITETRTAQQFLFDGYSDELIDLALKLKMKKLKFPYDKFGWFYSRNGSESYDGNWTMWTGEDDIQKTGIMTEWKGLDHSEAFDGECGRIDGSTGEVWFPVKKSQTISMFVPDVCSVFTLQRQGSKVSNGIKGNLYVATDKLLDTGKKYPETACFSPGEDIPTGVRDISACQYNAPAYISLPHFQMADTSYRTSIDGMSPDPSKHKIEIIIEPEYGLPVEAYVTFQANFKIYPVKEIELLSKLKELLVPYFWMKVSVVIPDDYALLIKFALNAVAIGQWIGYSLIFVSLLLFMLGVYLELRIRNISLFGSSKKISLE